MRQALELALKFVEDSECGTADLEARIKEALAQPEQREPTKQEHNILMRALKRSGKVVAQPEQNLNCKSTQARLATAWGYVKAQPEHLPVKMVAYNCTCGRTMKFESVHGVVAPQRTWVGLTDEEIDYYIVHRCGVATKKNLVELIRLCEIKLKEKNT